MKTANRIAATILAAVLALAGCGQASADGGTRVEGTDSVTPASAETAQTASPAEEGTAAEISLEEIYDAISAEVDLPEMYFADDNFLMNYYGIDAALLRDYVFASCEDAARVDTVILMRLKDGADAATVTDGLNVLLSQMEAEMDNYNPGAHSLVTAAEVRSNGDFLDLVISADREAICAVIDRMTR